MARWIGLVFLFNTHIYLHLKANAMIKGNDKVQGNDSEPKRFNRNVGFTTVEVRAVNPTKTELNVLLGQEDRDDDREVEYLGEDPEGNKRVRLAFWLYSAELDKYFVHSFNLTNKKRVSKDETKTQYVNSVCSATWSDRPENLPQWFTKFTDKDKEVIGDKLYHEAIYGEDELVTLMRSWVRYDWFDADTEVVVETDRLLDGDYSELRDLISSKYVDAFVCLLGIRTDRNDVDKKYQQVWGKGFLPKAFGTYIGKNLHQSGKWPNATAKKTWDKFEKDLKGEYGFDCYYVEGPAKLYVPAEDIANSQTTKAELVTPINSKY
jgi:hypothetical protein